MQVYRSESDGHGHGHGQGHGHGHGHGHEMFILVTGRYSYTHPVQRKSGSNLF
jgi:hypothetical protein